MNTSHCIAGPFIKFANCGRHVTSHESRHQLNIFDHHFDEVVLRRMRKHFSAVEFEVSYEELGQESVVVKVFANVLKKQYTVTLSMGVCRSCMRVRSHACGCADAKYA